MEREFLDVLDYELSVSEADILDLHETLIPSRSSKSPAQLHPFFHTSALERAPRPQPGVQMFRTRRITDDDDDDDDDEEQEQEQESRSVSSGSLYGDEIPSTPETPTSSGSSPEHSTAVTSVSSQHPQLVSKSVPTEDENGQFPAISRALFLAGHQLISGLPTAFPQIAVSA